MYNVTENTNIFFDLDGTLHKENMFSCFFFYMLRKLPYNMILVVLVFPIIIFIFLIYGQYKRLPVSILLWAVTAGNTDKKLQKIYQNFINYFKCRMHKIKLVEQYFNLYIEHTNVVVWIITGSPECLVKEIYKNIFLLHNVNIIGSKIKKRFFGWILVVRCIEKEKVIQLKTRIGQDTLFKFHAGYSDSKLDIPILKYCTYKWKINSTGNLEKFL